MRKFWLTLISIVGFIAIALINPQVDLMGLGLGIGFLNAPMAAANAMEHKFKNNK